MAFGGRPPQPIRRLPSFSRGFAKGFASAAPRLWRHLSLAWAPFLGTHADPTRLTFGYRFRQGQASVTGGRPAQSVWGPAWEHTSTSDVVTFADTNAQALLLKPIDGATSPQPYTILIGWRKTDATFRSAGTYGCNAFLGTTLAGQIPNAAEQLVARYLAPNGESNLLIDLSGQGHTWQEDHVYAFSAGGLGKRGYVDGRLVGSAAPPTASNTGGGNFTLGNGQGLSGDLGVYGFLYLFSEQLDDQQIAELTADPGLPFRPALTGLGKNPLTVANITLPASGAGSMDGQLSAFGRLAPPAAGAGALGGQLTGLVAAVLPASGAGSMDGQLSGLGQVVPTAAGAGSMAGQPTGLGQMTLPVVGGSSALLYFDLNALRDVQTFFVVDATTGLPVTAGAGGMSFEVYLDDTAAALPVTPSILEIGGGVYKFYPNFPASSARGVVYLVNTGVDRRPARVLGYLRPTDQVEDDLATLLQAATGGWRVFDAGPDADFLVIYQPDGVTTLARFPLKDLAGAPSATAYSQLGPRS